MTLLGIPYTMTRSQICTRMLWKYNGTGNDTRPCLDVDIDCINGLISCWHLTNRQYVIIGACLNLDVSLLGFLTDDTIAIAYSPGIQIYYNGDGILLCANFDWIWDDGVMLVLTEQQVRWYWCIFEFEFVIAWVHARRHHRDYILICYSTHDNADDIYTAW